MRSRTKVQCPECRKRVSMRIRERVMVKDAGQTVAVLPNRLARVGELAFRAVDRFDHELTERGFEGAIELRFPVYGLYTKCPKFRCGCETHHSFRDARCRMFLPTLDYLRQLQSQQASYFPLIAAVQKTNRLIMDCLNPGLADNVPDALPTPGELDVALRLSDAPEGVSVRDMIEELTDELQAQAMEQIARAL